MRFAIVYYSKYGQTMKIADFLQQYLISKSGNNDSVYMINSADEYDCSNIRYDVDHVIIGCPIYVGHFSKNIRSWVDTNRSHLKGKKIWLFMVSLNAADSSDQAKKTDQLLQMKLISELKIQPHSIASFAGSLNYLKYDFFIRYIMKKISQSAGGPTDTSCNHELTDWKQVKEFADKIFQEDQDGIKSNMKYKINCAIE